MTDRYPVSLPASFDAWANETAARLAAESRELEEASHDGTSPSGVRGLCLQVSAVEVARLPKEWLRQHVRAEGGDDFVFAQAVNRLQQALLPALLERLRAEAEEDGDDEDGDDDDGDEEEKRSVPPTPQGLAVVGRPWVDGLSDPTDVDLPARMPRGARLVYGGVTSYYPGYSSLHVYRLGQSRRRTHWVLWWVSDHVDYANRLDTVAVAWCPRRGVAAREAAIYLLRAHFAAQDRAGQGEVPHPFEDWDVLEPEEVEALLVEVWPDRRNAAR